MIPKRTAIDWVPFFGKYKGVPNHCLLRSLTASRYKYSRLSKSCTN